MRKKETEKEVAKEFKMLTANEARNIAVKAYSAVDLQCFLEEVQVAAQNGALQIHLSDHHMDLIPVLQQLGYHVSQVSDNIGEKFLVMW